MPDDHRDYDPPTHFVKGVIAKMVPERSDNDPGPTPLPPHPETIVHERIGEILRRLENLERSLFRPNDPEAVKTLEKTLNRLIADEVQKRIESSEHLGRLQPLVQRAVQERTQNAVRPTTSFSTEQVERALEDWFGPHGLNRDSPNYTMNMQKMRRVLTNFLGSLQ